VKRGEVWSSGRLNGSVIDTILVLSGTSIFSILRLIIYEEKCKYNFVC
jgi:hypothetical protein